MKLINTETGLSPEKPGPRAHSQPLGCDAFSEETNLSTRKGGSEIIQPCKFIPYFSLGSEGRIGPSLPNGLVGYGAAGPASHGRAPAKAHVDPRVPETLPGPPPRLPTMHRDHH